MRNVRCFLLVLAACKGSSGAGSTQGPRPTRISREAGLAAFETVRTVLQHPRCQNCHPGGDTPLQGDDGRVHSQNIVRGPTGIGVVGAECSSCHREANPPDSYGPNQPPGSANGWHMPPPEMKLVFAGVAPGALCEQIKDPARNGGKDAAALRAHLDDPLVLWGWTPGFGRTPVSVPHQDFVAAFETWSAAGAPCP
ncbi:MAG: hypothetical protein H6Q90_2521 [Deltaproteobacteria bacterium]|nr:hypothetical protein [Deltaproteobacteria bacterium]